MRDEEEIQRLKIKQDFAGFLEASKQLYAKDPVATRLKVKFRTRMSLLSSR